jgi:hypothetical protein
LSSEPLADSLLRFHDPEYAAVLAGIRETTAAVEQAFVFPSAPADAIVDEVVALGVHARRLRELGAPDRRARFTHDALLSELAKYQDQLVVARGEARADLYSGQRIRELVAELAPYA